MTLTQNNQRSLWQLRLLVMAATLIFASCAYSQTMPRPSGTPPADPTSSDRDKDDSWKNYGSPENEMRAKLIIKEDKKRYDENLARVREVSQLASQLRQSYGARTAFSSDDGKRLERLEKLTKRIRNEAGGSDSEPDADIKDISPDMQDTLKRVAEMAEELQKMVEKTPRQVVSASVIDQANKLIGLVQHVRGTR